MAIVGEEFASGRLTRWTQVQGARWSGFIANFLDHLVVDRIEYAEEESAYADDGREDEHFCIETEESYN